MDSSSGAAHDEPLQLALSVIRILEDLGATAWVGGSLASSIFGIPRATQDADIVADLRVEMARPLVERLGEEFYADAERIDRAYLQAMADNLELSDLLEELIREADR